MTSHAKRRARAAGVPFDPVAIRDVLRATPSHCPVLGSAFTPGGVQRTAPSLDRFRPELGYVQGNMTVISYRANWIKTNSTPEELLAVAAWVQKKIGGQTAPDPVADNQQ